MIVEIALATHTAPADWWTEDDATLATALDLLARQAAEIEAAGKRKGRR